MYKTKSKHASEKKIQRMAEWHRETDSNSSKQLMKGKKTPNCFFPALAREPTLLPWLLFQSLKHLVSSSKLRLKNAISDCSAGKLGGCDSLISTQVDMTAVNQNVKRLLKLQIRQSAFVMVHFLRIWLFDWQINDGAYFHSYIIT